jgi:hypothetical protein
VNENLIHPEHSPEKFETKEQHQEHPENNHEKPEIVEKKHDVLELHKNAVEKAVSAKEVTVGEQQETGKQSIYWAQKELKNDAYNRTLKKVRGRLNPLERTFSKVVHQPFIDAVSNFSGKTVARPSGILGGGFFALAGSGLLLYISRHYGFEYNFSVFLILFAGGFIAGLSAELALRFTRR